MTNIVSFKKITTGEFDVLKNGNDTGYRIVNGSKGLSGKDTLNMYGIVKPNGDHKWIGTLQACKKIMIYTLTR